MNVLIDTYTLESMVFAKNPPKLFDCRFKLDDPNWGEEQYKQNHIPGAIYCHLERHLSGAVTPGVTGRHPLPQVDEFKNLLQKWGLEKESDIVIYDQGPGAFAARFWWMLRSFGFNSVSVLDGGYAKWVGERRKVEEILVEPQATTNSVTGAWSKVISAEDLQANLEKISLLDARAPERFSGEKEPIDPIGGHIPGAINAPFRQNLSNEGCFKAKEELAIQFREVVSKGLPIVAYCGSGVTATHNILALAHAGVNDVLLYPGSWSEWICHDRPIVTPKPS